MIDLNDLKDNIINIADTSTDYRSSMWIYFKNGKVLSIVKPKLITPLQRMIRQGYETAMINGASHEITDVQLHPNKLSVIARIKEVMYE